MEKFQRFEQCFVIHLEWDFSTPLEMTFETCMSFRAESRNFYKKDPNVQDDDPYWNQLATTTVLSPSTARTVFANCVFASSSNGRKSL